MGKGKVAFERVRVEEAMRILEQQNDVDRIRQDPTRGDKHSKRSTDKDQNRLSQMPFRDPTFESNNRNIALADFDRGRKSSKRNRDVIQKASRARV